MTDLCEMLPSCFTVTTECHSWCELSPQRHMDRIFRCWHGWTEHGLFTVMNGMFSGLKGFLNHVLKIGILVKFLFLENIQYISEMVQQIEYITTCFILKMSPL